MISFKFFDGSFPLSLHLKYFFDNLKKIPQACLFPTGGHDLGRFPDHEHAPIAF